MQWYRNSRRGLARKRLAPLSPASPRWHEEDLPAQRFPQPSRSYWSELGEGGRMRDVPVELPAPAPGQSHLSIPSLM